MNELNIESKEVQLLDNFIIDLSDSELNLDSSEKSKDTVDSESSNFSEKRVSHFLKKHEVANDNFLDLKNIISESPKLPKLIKRRSSRSDKNLCFLDKNSSLKFNKKIPLHIFEESLKNFVYVEPCENKQDNYNKYIQNSMKSMKNFDKIDFEPLILERSVKLGEKKKKLTLVLDLDETLIHSDFDMKLDGSYHPLEFLHEDEYIQFNLFLRPYLMEFLIFAKENFEVVAFTASYSTYAKRIIDFLDPNKEIFTRILTRDSCIPIKNKVYVKDLRLFKDRILEEIIIIDNSLYAFINQLSNGILITSFYNSEEDFELLNLINYLKKILEIGDIMNFNRKVFNFEGIFNEMNHHS